MSSLWNLFQILWSLRPITIARNFVLNDYRPTQFETLNNLATWIVIGVGMIIFYFYKKLEFPLKFDLFAGIIIFSFAVYLISQFWFWLILLCSFIYAMSWLRNLVT